MSSQRTIPKSTACQFQIEVLDLTRTMATKEDDLIDEFSKLSTTTQNETKTDNVIDPAWLTAHSIKDGYSFWCHLTLKQLVDRQLSQKYFQELIFIIEKEKQIYDFHMRLYSKGQNGLTVDVLYKSVANNLGPDQGDVCISCDMNNPLSQLSLIKKNPTTNIWLDAQLRNKLIITPQKHIEKLSQMSDEEMTQFWQDAQVILDEEGCNWESMILNHGKYRSHSHLHMKINIKQTEWIRCIENKYKEKIQQMQDLFACEERNANIKKYFGNRKFNKWSGIKQQQ
ncbi:unnamed protein product [Rotaria magnacalcarata]|uniref:Uncharacterized protein n=2 Tax=Rotaria magnacalcarata TaxID=392030 RepID=A0A816QIG8_9BILA|nr:unnamed protein product [Rotaria magnacalcarata]CAF4533381.1 unnamed protein product [Rotaria magnacalcarata]